MAVIFNIDEAVQNSAFNVLQEPIKFILENETEQFERKSIINKVFVMKTANKYREEFRSTTTMDGFKPTEDMEPAGITDFEEGYNKQYVFQTWTNGFVVSKQTMEDGDTSDVGHRATKFIKSYGRTRENYAVRMIGAALGKDYADYKIRANKDGCGMDTTDGTIDGTKQQYFHNAHKTVKLKGEASSRVTYSNKFYANLDWTGADPELEEKVIDVIGQVASIMGKYKDDKGNHIGVKPTRIVMGDDYRLKDTIERALKTKYGSKMGDNGVTLFGGYELVDSSYLSDVDGFEDADHALILIDPERNVEGMGATFYDRIPLTVDSWIDKKTKANYVDGRARFGAGFGDPRAMAYINLANGETTNSTQITPRATAVKAVAVTNTVKVDTELADTAQGTETNPVVTKAKTETD